MIECIALLELFVLVLVIVLVLQQHFIVSMSPYSFQVILVYHIDRSHR